MFSSYCLSLRARETPSENRLKMCRGFGVGKGELAGGREKQRVIKLLSDPMEVTD